MQFLPFVQLKRLLIYSFLNMMDEINKFSTPSELCYIYGTVIKGSFQKLINRDYILKWIFNSPD